jgi:hypothetical protein
MLGAGDWSNQANSDLATLAWSLNNNFTSVTVNSDGSGAIDQTYITLSENVPYIMKNDSSWKGDTSLALATAVAQDTGGRPWLCNGGISARVGRAGSRFSVGLDASLKNGIKGTGSINLFNLGGVRGNWSVKGGNQDGNVTVPIPSIPLNASFNLTSQHPTVGVGRNVGIPGTNIRANLQGYGSFGQFGDPSCR